MKNLWHRITDFLSWWWWVFLMAFVLWRVSVNTARNNAEQQACVNACYPFATHYIVARCYCATEDPNILRHTVVP